MGKLKTNTVLKRIDILHTKSEAIYLIGSYNLFNKNTKKLIQIITIAVRVAVLQRLLSYHAGFPTDQKSKIMATNNYDYIYKKSIQPLYKEITILKSH